MSNSLHFEIRTSAFELSQSVTIDWTLRESARARIKVTVKRILNKPGYPPDLQEEAVQTVLAQAEWVCRGTAVLCSPICRPPYSPPPPRRCGLTNRGNAQAVEGAQEEKQAIELRQQSSLGLADTNTAATALEHGFPLVTRNGDDFCAGRRTASHESFRCEVMANTTCIISSVDLGQRVECPRCSPFNRGRAYANRMAASPTSTHQSTDQL